MRDAACHLTQRPQPFLLHHRLLRLPQVVISLLQRRVKLRVMRRQRDVFAQLLDKLALTAAEMRLAVSSSAATSTPKTWLSTSSGATTSEPNPPCASRCGNGNLISCVFGSYTSWPRTQRERPFSSMEI